MSFPNIIWGDFGDEKETSSTRIGNLPLGTRMQLPDGRVFAHCLQGGTAAIAGEFYMSEVAGTTGGCIAGSALVVDAAAAVGATTVSVTIGASGAITANQFADGYLTITAGTVGMGHIYRVISNTVASTLQASCQIVLDPDDGIKVALIASSTLVQLRTNPFKNLILKPAGSTFLGNPAGIPPIAIPAGYYGWVQRSGVAAALTAATAVAAGAPLCCSSTEAGALNEATKVETTAYSSFVVGVNFSGASANKWSTVYLALP
jgi:hypothetical protein